MLKLPILLFSFFAFSHYCHAEVTPMTQEQLKMETGKGFSTSISPMGTIAFSMDEQTKNGTPISASGTLDVLQKTQQMSQSNLSLSDSAQQNLQAFININAVESAVQVLVNMTVNIGSTVGIIEQANNALQNQQFIR